MEVADETRFDLADTFADVARALVSEEGKQATLERICRLAVETIDACDHAGVTLLERSHIHSVAASDDVPRAIDEMQDEAQEGPCFDAIREQEIFMTGALGEEERWPSFSRRAFERSGVNSILSVPLFSEADTIGAINLYAKTGDAYDDDDVHVATIFAAHAAVAVIAMRHEEQLRDAIESRDVIGRAKGILMARGKVSDAEAFDMLRSASQRMNVKLREVARRVAEGAGSEPESSAAAFE